MIFFFSSLNCYWNSLTLGTIRLSTEKNEKIIIIDEWKKRINRKKHKLHWLFPRPRFPVGRSLQVGHLRYLRYWSVAGSVDRECGSVGQCDSDGGGDAGDENDDLVSVVMSGDCMTLNGYVILNGCANSNNGKTLGHPKPLVRPQYLHLLFQSSTLGPWSWPGVFPILFRTVNYKKLNSREDFRMLVKWFDSFIFQQIIS